MRVRRRSCAEAGLAATPIDPDGRESMSMGRGDVVVQALGHVQDATRIDADPVDRDSKVVRGRFVGSSRLRGHDPIEGHAQTPR